MTAIHLITALFAFVGAWCIIGFKPLRYYWISWRRKRSGFESEFGSGQVVCLVKFMEHMGGHWFERVRDAHYWMGLTPSEREVRIAESEQFPNGDTAKRIANAQSVFLMREPMPKAISHAIELWMNGASDHFYDLDKRNCPEPLKELATMALEIGHGFTNRTWDFEKTYNELWRLIRESALALDTNHGVPNDWGQW